MLGTIAGWFSQITLRFFVEMNDLHSLAGIITVEGDANILAIVKKITYFFKEFRLSGFCRYQQLYDNYANNSYPLKSIMRR